MFAVRFNGTQTHTEWSSNTIRYTKRISNNRGKCILIENNCTEHRNNNHLVVSSFHLESFVHTQRHATIYLFKAIPYLSVHFITRFGAYLNDCAINVCLCHANYCFSNKNKNNVAYLRIPNAHRCIKRELSFVCIHSRFKLHS